MKIFQQNATFSSFDIQSLTSRQPTVVASMMQKIKNMHAEGRIKPLLRKAFSVSDLNDAFNDTIKVAYDGAVLTFHPSTDKIYVGNPPYELTFSPEASYILIGCLGGLGRSFAEWTVSRGARMLTFLSRTGAVGQEAQDLMSKLQNMAIEVQVVRGDVTSMADVEHAIKSCTGLIKGIVQAAFTLHDSFFSEMTLDDFRATMDPRVKGTLNLQRALEKTALDSFLM